jgi:hypothetical protein
LKIKTGLVDKKTGRPLNTLGNPRSMKYLDICAYEYSKVVSILINQVASEYKLVYNGSHMKTLEVVRAVMYQLLMTEYPLRISKTALCSSHTMRDTTDRLSDIYPRLFNCLRGFPTLKGNVPSVITWNYGVRERFLKDVMKNYHSTSEVFNLAEYEVPVVDDIEVEKRYLANKAKFNKE